MNEQELSNAYRQFTEGKLSQAQLNWNLKDYLRCHFDNVLFKRMRSPDFMGNKPCTRCNENLYPDEQDGIWRWICSVCGRDHGAIPAYYEVKSKKVTSELIQNYLQLVRQLTHEFFDPS